MLIEVIVSTLMVAFIAVATFSGFDVVNRSTADQRHHDQAAVLAAQSQELLRSDPAATLDELQNSPHTYTQTLNKEQYTIVQEAVPINEAKQSTGCSAIGSEGKINQNGDYIRITSSVRWSQLAAGRPAVSQSSLITPPDGSGLEVDATNGSIPLQPVPGVTAVVRQPSAHTEAEAATGENGCVVFGAIPATRVNVEAYKLGDVVPSGAFKAIGNEILITPNRTTRYEVTFARGGAITAEFTYKGAAIYNEKQVTGDTFVAANSNMKVAPNFEVGSTQIAYNGEGAYEALTGTYKPEATTPINAADYPTGDLFPFENSWAVYAGDCVADLPPESGSARVEPGVTTKVKVPMSYVTLAVYEGTPLKSGPVTKQAYKVKITNTGCAASSAPNNASKANLAHEQLLNGEGGLTVPFQPFGEYKLCVYNNKTLKTFTVSYTNTTVAGSSANIYLEQKSEKGVTVAEKQASC